MDDIKLKDLGLFIAKDLKGYAFVKEKRSIIPYAFAKDKGLLPLEEKDSKIIVATYNPIALDAIEDLYLFLNKEIDIVYSSKEVLEEAIEECYHQKSEDTDKFFTSLTHDKENQAIEDEVYDLLEQSHQNPVVRMLNLILIDAIQQGSSDVHFEPKEKGLDVRYRIDGILIKKHSSSLEYRSQLIARIKIMAKLDIAEQRLPQDGRIKLRMGGREIDFRVSTIPIVYGERIVLRILDKANIVLGLDKIGMNEEVLNNFRKLITIPEGIVLVTGPTGSGKTTTLYSALSEINSVDKNIMTIEDPVEYKLSNVAQIGVNPKIDLSFSKGLRHILRQDPDAIMIGEIRDVETAQIAIQSALTGHLVLSTLHTNDAPSALTRLADMGIEPYLLASSIIGVLAQRLVRKICPHCKRAYIPSTEELKQLGMDKKTLDNSKLYKGQGCNFCFGTGYKGRIGIYELMIVNSQIRKQMIGGLDVDAIRQIALKYKMKELFCNGRELVINGVTTSSELLRVTSISEELSLE